MLLSIIGLDRFREAHMNLNRFIVSFFFLIIPLTIAHGEGKTYLQDLKGIIELKQLGKITQEEFLTRKEKLKTRLMPQKAKTEKKEFFELNDKSIMVRIGDTKEQVVSSLGKATYDGGCYLRYGPSEVVYFDDNGRVKEVSGFSNIPDAKLELKQKTAPVILSRSEIEKEITRLKYEESCLNQKIHEVIEARVNGRIALGTLPASTRRYLLKKEDRLRRERKIVTDKLKELEQKKKPLK